MHDSVILGCVRLAERNSTPKNEADAAAIMAFARIRANNISLSDIITGDADESPLPQSVLLRQKVALASENVSLKKKMTALETKSSTLEKRLAAARAENLTLRAENTKLRASISTAPKPFVINPKAKAKHGFVPYLDFYRAADDAYGNKNGWRVVFAKLAGINVATINAWKSKDQVPEAMLRYIPELRTNRSEDDYAWALEDCHELVRIYNMAPRPTYPAMAEHMSSFTGHKISENSISGKLRVLRSSATII